MYLIEKSLFKEVFVQVKINLSFYFLGVVQLTSLFQILIFDPRFDTQTKRDRTYEVEGRCDSLHIVFVAHISSWRFYRKNNAVKNLTHLS